MAWSIEVLMIGICLAKNRVQTWPSRGVTPKARPFAIDHEWVVADADWANGTRHQKKFTPFFAR